MNIDYTHSKLLSLLTLGAVLGLPFALLLNLVYLSDLTVLFSYLVGMVSITIYAAGMRYLNIKSMANKKKLIFSIIWLGITGAIIGSRINMIRTSFTAIEGGLYGIILLTVSIKILSWRGLISFDIDLSMNSMEDAWKLAGYFAIGAFLINLLLRLIFGSRFIHISQEMIGAFSGFGLGAIYGFFVGRFSDYIYSLNQLIENFFEGLLKKMSRGSSIRKTTSNTTTDEITCQKCGIKNKKNADFCKGCGEKLTETDFNRCGNCGTKNPEDANICMNCGESLGGTDVW